MMIENVKSEWCEFAGLAKTILISETGLTLEISKGFNNLNRWNAIICIILMNLGNK